MFRMIVETQWKWTRGVILIATLIGFGLPLASLQNAHNGWNPSDFVNRMQQWGAAYALLAAALGLFVALAAWSSDQRGRHVYALSLPVSRARYVSMRFGAGALFLLPATLGVLFGAVLVAAFGSIPSGLHAYPIALTIRFALAAFVAYALFFAIASSTQKTAGVLLGIVAVLLLTQYMLAIADIQYNLLEKVFEMAFTSPGVFSVFSGRWMLVDV